MAKTRQSGRSGQPAAPDAMPTRSAADYTDDLTSIYLKLIPLQERRDRIIGRMQRDGHDIDAIGGAAFEAASEQLAPGYIARKRAAKTDAPKGIEGTPLGDLLS